MSNQWKYKNNNPRPSKPYERQNNQSVLSRVTTTVRDNLIPSWIKNAASFLIPTTKSNEESEPATEFPSTSEPVTNVKEVFDHPSGSKTDPVSSYPSGDLIASSFKKSALNTDDENSSVASSTSGCSSLIPSYQDHPLPRVGLPLPKTSIESLRKELMRKTRDVGIGTEKRKEVATKGSNDSKLFFWPNESQIGKPSFTLSKFVSPSSVLANVKTSPYYEGKTSFGGASNKRSKLSLKSDTFIEPWTTSVKIKPTDESGLKQDNLSNAARKILSSMEHISSPLQDAKKLAAISERKSVLQEVPKFRRFPVNYSFTRQSQVVPSKKAKPDSSISYINTDYEFNQNKNDYEPTSNVSTFSNAKVGGKMRMRVTKREDDHKIHGKEEVADIPFFQDAVDFKFTDSFPKSVSFTKMSTPNENISNSSNEFIFSHPLLFDDNSGGLSTSVGKSPLKFQEPIDYKDEIKKSDNKMGIQKSDTSPNVIKFKSTTDETISCPICMIKLPSKSEKCNACQCSLNFNRPQLVQSVSFPTKKIEPKIDKNEKMMEVSSLKSFVSSNKDSWECNTCLVRNKNTHIKCIACESPKLQDKLAEPTYTGFNFENLESKAKLFKNVDMWECGSCMVRNNKTDKKCVSCESPKESTTELKTTEAVCGGFSFSNLNTDTKLFSSEEECSSCMLKNKTSDIKFIPFETPKDGLKTNEDSTKSFSFKTVETEPQFKFGVADNLLETEVSETKNKSSKPMESTFSLFKPVISSEPPANLFANIASNDMKSKNYNKPIEKKSVISEKQPLKPLITTEDVSDMNIINQDEDKAKVYKFSSSNEMKSHKIDHGKLFNETDDNIFKKTSSKDGILPNSTAQLFDVNKEQPNLLTNKPFKLKVDDKLKLPTTTNNSTFFSTISQMIKPSSDNNTFDSINPPSFNFFSKNDKGFGANEIKPKKDDDFKFDLKEVSTNQESSIVSNKSTSFQMTTEPQNSFSFNLNPKLNQAGSEQPFSFCKNTSNFSLPNSVQNQPAPQFNKEPAKSGFNFNLTQLPNDNAFVFGSNPKVTESTAAPTPFTFGSKSLTTELASAQPSFNFMQQPQPSLGFAFGSSAFKTPTFENSLTTGLQFSKALDQPLNNQAQGISKATNQAFKFEGTPAFNFGGQSSVQPSVFQFSGANQENQSLRRDIKKAKRRLGPQS